jgi:hypothetical protein
MLEDSMAFTVTVIDRHDLETTAGRTCDGCDNGTCDAGACNIGAAAKGEVGDAVTVALSPLED